MRELIHSSPAALGSWAFGDCAYWPDQQHESSVQTLKTALRAGVRHLDTAWAYGNGRAEQLIGQQLHRLRGEIPRENILLATKIHTFDPHALERRVLESMRRLQSPYLDIVYLHWPHTTGDILPLYQELFRLKESGIIGHIGASNVPVESLKKISSEVPISICQFSFSLLWRAEEQQLVPWCRSRGIITAGYSPLGQGLLGGTDPETLRQKDPRRDLVFFDPEQRHRTAEVLAAVRLVARQSGRSMAEVALQWIAGTGMIDSIIFGARTPVQCTGVLDGLAHPHLSLQQQQYLTEAPTRSPPPGITSSTISGDPLSPGSLMVQSPHARTDSNPTDRT